MERVRGLSRGSACQVNTHFRSCFRCKSSRDTHGSTVVFLLDPQWARGHRFHEVRYTFDTSNRLLTKTSDPSFNAPTVTFTYFANGLRKTMSDVSGTAIYGHDNRNLTSKQTPFGTSVGLHRPTLGPPKTERSIFRTLRGTKKPVTCVFVSRNTG